MKIVAFEAEAWEREAFDVLAQEHEVECVEEKLNAETAGRHADADIVSTFIESSLDAETLKAFGDLKLIATRSTGVNHIDLEVCEENDITVSNVPTYGDNTVAEHVFGLLLTISHNLYSAVDRTRKGDFSRAGLRGFDLQGRTIAVIGTGSIGRHVIRMANGFGMNVAAHDVKEDHAFAREMGFEYKPLMDALSDADVLTLHTPLTDETRGMISTEQFEAMKEGVVLINTARGGLIDVRALLEALSSGKVSAVGLDVLPEEPSIREEAELLRSMFDRDHDLETLLADHVLLRLRNVYITPHSAFDTREAVHRILGTTVENIEGFLQGEPRNVAVPKHAHA